VTTPFDVFEHPPVNWKLHKPEDSACTYYITDNSDRPVGYVRVYSESDARLIQAAPRMLRVLRYAVAIYGKPGGPWNVPGDPGGWLEAALAAIAEAEGEA
jgi:hypothetical protein